MVKLKLDLDTNKNSLEVYCIPHDEWVNISKLQDQNLKIKEDTYGYEVVKFTCNCGMIHESLVR